MQMKSFLGHIAFVFAAAICSLQSADAQLAEPKLPDRVGWQPRSFACAETSAKLVFTKQDFEKGFNRFYTFPNVTECDGYEPGVSDFRERSGSLRLTYDPAARDPMTAEVRYRERYACDEGKGMAEHSFEWFGSLQPVDEDPDGIFPAAGFDSGMEEPAKFTYRPCAGLGEGAPSTPWISVYLGLVYQDDATGELVRKPFLQLDGGPSGAGEVAFGPVVEPSDGDVRLAVDGCAHISSGIDAVLTAYGEPEGGSYSWSATPSSVLSVDGDDATAVATAGSAGRGMVTVRYQDPEGRERSSQIEGSVVELESVNEGQPLPKLGLLDAKGKPTSKIVSVPVQMQPAGAGDLLDFKPDDPGIVISQGDGVRLHLQPLSEGTTVIQPRTVCGAAVGPAMPVQVVPCDDEVLAQLEREDQLAKEQHKNILQDIGKIRGSKELETAENETAKAAGDLLVKTGLLITGVLGGGKSATVAADVGASVLGHLDALYNLVNDTVTVVTDTGTENVPQALWSATQLAVEAAGSDLQQAGVDSLDAMDAAMRFSELLGTLVGENERLEWLAQQQEKYGREIEDIARRKVLCQPKKDGPKRDPDPKKCVSNCDPKPDPKPPVVPHPPPKTIDVPPDEPPPPNEPPVEEPPSPPLRVGLPYDQGKCGCGETRELPADQQGFAVLREGMGILNKCVTTFREGTLAPMAEAVKQGGELFVFAANATKAGPDAWISYATGTRPRIEELRRLLQSFGKPTQEFTAEMETCAGKPAAIEFGMYSPEAASQQPPLLDVKRP